MTATEFSADAEELQRFSDNGASYVGALERLLDRVRDKRSTIGSELGAGSPLDLASSPMEELIAEATIGNHFVGRIAEALFDVSGPGLVALDDASPIDRALAAAGLATVGADDRRADDLELAAQLREDRLVEAGLTVAEAQAIASDHSAVEAALHLLEAGAAPAVVAGVDGDQLERVAAAVPDPAAADAFDAEQIGALLTGAYPPQLEGAILSGRLAPPDDELREQLFTAMIAGVDPEDIGIDPAYIPAEYRRYAILEEQLDAANQRREDADGSSWFWWDNDDEALAAADRELAHIRGEMEELATDFGFGNHGAVGSFDAAALIGDGTAGWRWEGAYYGDEVAGYHEGLISDGGILGGGKGALKDPSGFGQELTHIGERIADNEAAAAAFYNEIGVGVAADLPSLLVGNGLDGERFAAFGTGLAVASQVDGRAGVEPLAFTGAELIEHPPRDTQNGVIWYGPALLFTAGDYDDEFLVDATVAALHLAESGEDHGIFTTFGSERAHGIMGGTTVSYDGGEDPRNVLLSRVAEHGDATRLLFTTLTSASGRNFSGLPAPGSLDPLLRPRVPLAPTIGPDPDVYWLDDALDSGHVAERHHVSIDAVAFPELSSDSPITSLLGTAADDDVLSRWVLLDTSRVVQAGDQVAVRDPGTAAGLDLILANHATLFFSPAELAAVGIDPTTLNDGTATIVGDQRTSFAPYPVQSIDVRAVYGEVLRFGRGQALALAADDLLDQAVAGAVDGDGFFQRTAARPFAQLAGWTDVRAEEAFFAYAANLDAEAREANRRINTAASFGLGVTGLLPGLGIPATVADTSWTYFFQGYPTTAELEARRDDRAEDFERNLIDRYETIAADALLRNELAAAGAGQTPSLPVVLSSGETIAVAIRQVETDGAVSYEWQHPDTLAWSPIPWPDDEVGFDALFPAGPDNPLWAAVAEGRGVADDYIDAQIASFAETGAPEDHPEVEHAPDLDWIDEWLGVRPAR